MIMSVDRLEKTQICKNPCPPSPGVLSPEPRLAARLPILAEPGLPICQKEERMKKYFYKKIRKGYAEGHKKALENVLKGRQGNQAIDLYGFKHV